MKPEFTPDEGKKRVAIDVDDGTNQMVTDRIKVPGGWLVRTRSFAITRPKKDGISGYAVHTIFIPTPDEFQT
jgi:hypothetical protein